MTRDATAAAHAMKVTKVTHKMMLAGEELAWIPRNSERRRQVPHPAQALAATSNAIPTITIETSPEVHPLRKVNRALTAIARAVRPQASAVRSPWSP